MLSSAFDASYIYPNQSSGLKVQQLNFFNFARRVCSVATISQLKNNRNHVLAILFSIPRHHSIFVIHGTAKGYHGSLWQTRFVTKAGDRSSRCTKSAMNFSTLAVYLLFFKLFLVAEWSLKARLHAELSKSGFGTWRNDEEAKATWKNSSINYMICQIILGQERDFWMWNFIFKIKAFAYLPNSCAVCHLIPQLIHT